MLSPKARLWLPLLIACLLATRSPAQDKGQAEREAMPVPYYVFVTGAKKHETAWAKKHGKRFACIQAVPDLSDAQGILDLEPVDAPHPKDWNNVDLPTVTHCYSSANGASVSCYDNTGDIERTECWTTKSGGYDCASTYSNMSQVETDAEAVQRAAETHAYLLTKDGKHIIWQYDESRHFLGIWPRNLKRFVKQYRKCHP